MRVNAAPRREFLFREATILTTNNFSVTQFLVTVTSVCGMYVANTAGSLSAIIY